jgi:cob(I)alamin adenosyltransferase
MSIYTKTGDQGMTSLYGGRRISKADNVIDAVGDVDELNSVMGLFEAELIIIGNQDLSDKVRQIKENLFMLGADLASPLDLNSKIKVVRISQVHTAMLENDIDKWEKILPQLTHFVLPAGTKAALTAYYARSICRRCERSLVRLNGGYPIDGEILKYINRLSDWLFVCFRLLNRDAGEKEHLWLS